MISPGPLPYTLALEPPINNDGNTQQEEIAQIAEINGVRAGKDLGTVSHQIGNGDSDDHPASNFSY